MSEKEIVVILPRLPPAIDGLGDYGFLLAKEMLSRYAIKTHFVVGDPDWKGQNDIGDFKISKVKNRSSQSLIDLLPEKGQVLLHYVGYGYAKRGCPNWLSKGLERWKQKPDRKLITMMHECYAEGPIWSIQFWTSRVQKNIFKTIASNSDRCLTSKLSYAKNIENYSQHRHKNIVVLPVFSNVGELDTNPQLDNRKSALVIFGSKGWRKKVYAESINDLKKVLKVLDIKTVIDIGSSLNMPTGLENSVEIKIMGNIPAEEISKIFSESKAGFLNYPTDYLSKSGIFSSYCAHGLIPVNGNCFSGESEVEINKTFVNAQDIELFKTTEAQQQISNNAFSWYQGHNLKAHAAQFRDILD